MRVLRIIFEKWRHTTPNYITLSRLLIGLLGLELFFWFYWSPWMMLFMCAISAALDRLDGWWARTFNEVSESGKLLDPFVDKTLGWNAVIDLAAYALVSHDAAWLIASVAWLPVLCLNLFYDVLTTTMRGTDDSMKTSNVAKLKQALLFVALGFMLLAIALRETARMATSDTQALAFHIATLVCLLCGTLIVWRCVPLFIASARTYLAHTSDPRAHQWREQRLIAWLLARS